MARALARHADDTFKEADTVLVGLLVGGGRTFEEAAPRRSPCFI